MIKKIILLTFLGIFPFASSAFAVAPILSYSDLVNGPATGGQGGTDGAFVTIWGHNFGVTQGASYVTIGGQPAAAYPVWSDTEISFQIDATTSTGAQNITVTTADGTSSALAFYVNTAGESVEIYFCDVVNGSDDTGDGSYATPWATPDPWLDANPDGQILYMRAGTYSGSYGYWMGTENIKIYQNNGSSTKYNAIIGYPGEVAELLKTASGRHIVDKYTLDESDYWVIANLELDGGGYSLGGISTGGDNCSDATCEESGSKNYRIVGVEIHNTFKGETTTMTGAITVNGDDYKIYGCYLHDIGISETVFTNNHIIYIRVGSDNTDIGWNTISGNAVGYQIQMHTDNADDYGVTWSNEQIHNNYIDGGLVAGDTRGITMSSVDPSSTAYIYNNIFSGIAGDNGAVAAYNGNIYIYNNTFEGCIGAGGTICLLCNNDQKFYVDNNIIISDGSAEFFHVGTGGCSSGVNASLDYVITCDNNVFYNGTGSMPASETASITTDPKLTDVANGVYTLQSDSPAIGAGVVLNNIFTTDYKDIIRGVEFDIGAYEYATGVTEGYQSSGFSGSGSTSYTGSGQTTFILE